MRTRALSGVLVAVLLGPMWTASGSPAVPVYLDTSYSPQERAVDLVSRMTLAEKAGQMVSSQSAALPRLGIAAYGWWNEATHGVAREGTLDDRNPPILVNTTSYPVDLSLGSTWNPELTYREAALISDEAREVVRDNSLDPPAVGPIRTPTGRSPRHRNGWRWPASPPTRASCCFRTPLACCR